MSSLLQAVNNLLTKERANNDHQKPSDRPQLDVAQVVNLVNQQTGAQPVQRGARSGDTRSGDTRSGDSGVGNREGDNGGDIGSGDDGNGSDGVREMTREEQISADQELAERLAREMDGASVVPVRRDEVNLNDGQPIRRPLRRGEFDEWLKWLKFHGVSHLKTTNLAILMREFFDIKAGRKTCDCGKIASEIGLVK